MRQIPARWRTATTVIALALALASAGCAPGASASRAGGAQPTATPSATPTPKTLYQADWSARASEWTAAPHWQVRNGALVNDGGGTDAIAIPYSPSVENYTIEVVMTVEEIRGPSACDNMFGMEGLTDSGQPVYYATVVCVDQQRHGFSELYPAQYIANDNSDAHTYDYTTGSSPHTYDVIVEGQYVTFNLNGSSLGTIDCGTKPRPSRLLLLDTHMVLSVQSVTITTP